MAKKKIKCYAFGCDRKADVVLVSPSRKQKKGYCQVHYGKGKWIERQGLFKGWKKVFQWR